MAKDVEIFWASPSNTKGISGSTATACATGSFAGGWSGELERELFERGHAVGVLPYDPGGRFRRADRAVPDRRAGRRHGSWLSEVVAGIIEAGEAPEEVARRETQEEAGIEVMDLMPICRYLVSPGGSSESVILYCGRVDSRGAGGIHGLRGGA